MNTYHRIGIVPNCSHCNKPMKVWSFWASKHTCDACLKEMGQKIMEEGIKKAFETQVIHQGIMAEINKSEAKPYNASSLPSEKELKEWVDDVFSNLTNNPHCTGIQFKDGKAYLVYH